MTVPKFGLGTFRLQGQVAFDAVKTALEVGYRAIDTAQIYDNETEVGAAIKHSAIPRQQLFITTKIWVDNYPAERLIPSLKDSLQKLGTDAVNLTLLHWPAPAQGVDIAAAIELLYQAKQLGLSQHIGLSNFNRAQVQQAVACIGAAQIATNQIELSPYLQNQSLVDALRQQNIDITSYMTLAYGKVLTDPVLGEIAAQHQATVAQVALAWALHQGYAVIPSSTKREHLRSNLLAQDLTLTADELSAIAQLERNGREVNPPQLAPIWD
jgi:2,5-diketo-D-gluconate reductase B